MSLVLKMILACLVPLALIFLLPLFGVGSGVTLAVFLVLMFAFHLMMMGGHDHSGHGGGHQTHSKSHLDPKTTETVSP